MLSIWLALIIGLLFLRSPLSLSDEDSFSNSGSASIAASAALGTLILLALPGTPLFVVALSSSLPEPFSLIDPRKASLMSAFCSGIRDYVELEHVTR